jgi:Ca-activated chloride channel family protein
MENDSLMPWYAIDWFYPETLGGFQWEWPWAFYLLLLLPIIWLLRSLILRYRKQSLPTSLSQVRLSSGWVVWLRLLPSFLLLLAVVLLITALARPQRTNERVEQYTEGIDIMLVIDISESMMIEDFKPNRMQAAKTTAIDFIEGRFQDRIGLVVFSGEAYSLSPLTTDYSLLEGYIRDISFEMIEARGTAIGSALAVGTNRMRESEAASKVVILLSDGDNTAGNIDPITAARLAAAFDIKVYTIAIGKEGKVPFGTDFFGRTRYVENTLDETTLREIAQIGSGRFFRVDDNAGLQAVFDEIDELEKAEIIETRYRDTQDYYTIYMKWGILFLLSFLFSKSTFMSNILRD